MVRPLPESSALLACGGSDDFDLAEKLLANLVRLAGAARWPSNFRPGVRPRAIRCFGPMLGRQRRPAVRRLRGLGGGSGMDARAGSATSGLRSA